MPKMSRKVTVQPIQQLKAKVRIDQNFNLIDDKNKSEINVFKHFHRKNTAIGITTYLTN